MDGVLVNSESFIADAAIAMFAEKGHQIRREEFRPFIGTGEDRFIGLAFEPVVRGLYGNLESHGQIESAVDRLW